MNQRKTTRAAVRLLGLALLYGASAQIMAASTFDLVNLDGPGEGFNDPTLVAPVDGNPGTTLGEQRVNVFLAAMEVWAGTLDSGVEIQVDAQFDPMVPCEPLFAVLGSAGTNSVHRDFGGDPVPNTWYGQALANSIAGVDLAPSNSDISATFNSDVDSNPGCLGGTGWDYRIPAAGTSLSLYSVVLHELGHGLNISSFVDKSTGAKLAGYDDIYSNFLFDQGTGEAWPDMTNAERAASVIGGDLFWNGANAWIAGIGLPLTAGQDPITQRVEMYAPNPLESGSSVSHFDKGLNPDELMEPTSTPNPLREVTTGAFVDMGWNAAYYGCGVDYTIDIAWHQIALPCVPATATVRAVFGDGLVEGNYGSRWIVWEWNPITESYVQLGIDDALIQGIGYWIRTLDGGTIHIDGSATALSNASPCPDTLNGCFAIDIGTAGVFHMVAHALPYSVDWSDVRFASGGDTKTPSQAQTADWAENFFYRYNGSSYDTHDDTVIPTTLDSHDGIWVETLTSAPADLQLLFPASGPNTPGISMALAFEGAGARGLAQRASVVESSVTPSQSGRTPPAEWSVHLTAAADGMTAANNLLGWHPESRQRYDRRDLPELPPFSAPYLTLVFPHPEWPDDKDGDYTTDFHRSRSRPRMDTWTIEVRSDDPARSVELSWEGPPEVLKHMVVVDLETGEKTKGLAGRYRFDLSRETRTFRWQYHPRKRTAGTSKEQAK